MFQGPFLQGGGIYSPKTPLGVTVYDTSLVLSGVAHGASAPLSCNPVIRCHFPLCQVLFPLPLPPWDSVPGVVLPFPVGWLIPPLC